MQSSWAIGYGAAAVVTGLVMPLWGWRGVFFVGVLPALLTIWVRKNVKEPRDLACGASVTPPPQGAECRDIFRGALPSASRSR